MARPVVTRVTSASSMCTQVRVVTTTATGVTSGYVRPSTQTTDASCQGGHYRQHIPQGPRPGSSQILSTPVISSIGSGLAHGNQVSVAFNPVVQTGNTQTNLHGSPQGVQALHNTQPWFRQQQCSAAENSQPQCRCRSGHVAAQTGLDQAPPVSVQPFNGSQQGWNQPSVQVANPSVTIPPLQQSYDQVLIPPSSPYGQLQWIKTWCRND